MPININYLTLVGQQHQNQKSQQNYINKTISMNRNTILSNENIQSPSYNGKNIIYQQQHEREINPKLFHKKVAERDTSNDKIASKPIIRQPFRDINSYSNLAKPPRQINQENHKKKLLNHPPLHNQYQNRQNNSKHQRKAFCSKDQKKPKIFPQKNYNQTKKNKISMRQLKYREPISENQNYPKIQRQPNQIPTKHHQNDRMAISVENSDKIRQDGTIPIKLVIVGDACVGKTSLLISYTSNQFKEDHIPTVFENYVADVKCDSKKIKLWLWDTAGQEEYQKIRFLSYQKTDIFLICFSMVDQISFRNALNKWLPQVEDECPGAFKLFIGTKSDLYEEQLQKQGQINKLITLQKMERQINSRKYQLLTCNSLTQKGLNQVFTTSIRKILKRVEHKREKDSSLCQLI